MRTSGQVVGRRSLRYDVAAASLVLATLISVVVSRSERVVTSRDLLPQALFQELNLPLTMLGDAGIVSGGLPPEADGVWLGSGLVRIAFEGPRSGGSVLVLELYSSDWQASAPAVVATNSDGATVGSVSVMPGRAATLEIRTDAIRGGDRDDVATFEVTLACTSDEPDDDDLAPVLCLKLFGVRLEPTVGAS